MALAVTGAAHIDSIKQQGEEGKRRKAAHEQRLREWETAQTGGPRLDRLIALLRAMLEVARDYEQAAVARATLEQSMSRHGVRWRWVSEAELADPAAHGLSPTGTVIRPLLASLACPGESP